MTVKAVIAAGVSWEGQLLTDMDVDKSSPSWSLLKTTNEMSAAACFGKGWFAVNEMPVLKVGESLSLVDITGTSAALALHPVMKPGDQELSDHTMKESLGD